MSPGTGFRVDRLRVSYGGQRVLDDTSGTFHAGRMGAIVGPNGAGKSTLVKAMLGLIPIDRGAVTLFGDPVRRHRHRIAYVPQRSDIDWSYPATVAEVTGMGRYPLGRLWRRTSARDRERVRDALRTVSLAGFGDRAIGALSGGTAAARVPRPRHRAGSGGGGARRALHRHRRGDRVPPVAGPGRDGTGRESSSSSCTTTSTRSPERFDDVAILSGRLVACGSVESTLTERNIAIAYRRPRSGGESGALHAGRSRRGNLTMDALWASLWTPVWNLFAAPVLDYGFMRHALAVVVIVGITSSVLSCLLVVRRQALMGDAISHSVLVGVVLGWMLGRHAGIFWGALASGILSGIAITYVERNSRVKLDAAMGVFFTFAFALGLAIISMVRPTGIDLFHVLFGNVLGVGPGRAGADRALWRAGARHPLPLLPRISSVELR